MLEFYKTDRKPLTSEERSYWRWLVSRLAKVGIELEYNLKEQKDMCYGDSICACKHLNNDSACWRRCADEAVCTQLNLSPTICKNACPTCDVEACQTCSLFSWDCKAERCPLFTPYCVECVEYDPGCEECSRRYDASKDPKEMREHVIRLLKPTRCYGDVGAHGVFDVVKDGSLLGDKGMEIITTGRRPYYWSIHSMLTNILDTADKNGGYLSERSSTHMHLLLAYYDRLGNTDLRDLPARISELDGSNVPEIILANLHQLVIRYQNSLVWMGMGLDNPDALTRWEKFRVSVMSISAVRDHMSRVRELVSKNAGGNKYGFINYLFTEFDNISGDVSRFHVEFRGLDGINSPSALAAFACLYYALLMEAVDLSEYGVLRAFTDEEYKTEMYVKQAILNNMKSYGDGDRFGDTSTLYNHYDHLAARSMELIGLLKHHLESVGPAYDVLSELAKRPVALRRAGGQSWAEIEEEIKVTKHDNCESIRAIQKVIDLVQVCKQETPDAWITEVSKYTNKSQDEIRNTINELMLRGCVFWSKPLGTFKMKAG